VDIPRIFNITESVHRIHNPFTPEKLATLGEALRLERGTRVLDLGSGSGEMLCTWARDFGVIGTGIDMSQLFSMDAVRLAVQLAQHVASGGKYRDLVHAAILSSVTWEQCRTRHPGSI
jgi:tRNA A58 N-methylase Trm61